MPFDFTPEDIIGGGKKPVSDESIKDLVSRVVEAASDMVDHVSAPGDDVIGRYMTFIDQYTDQVDDKESAERVLDENEDDINAFAEELLSTREAQLEVYRHLVEAGPTFIAAGESLNAVIESLRKGNDTGIAGITLKLYKSYVTKFIATLTLLSYVTLSPAEAARAARESSPR